MTTFHSFFYVTDGLFFSILVSILHFSKYQLLVFSVISSISLILFHFSLLLLQSFSRSFVSKPVKYIDSYDSIALTRILRVNKCFPEITVFLLAVLWHDKSSSTCTT